MRRDSVRRKETQEAEYRNQKGRMETGETEEDAKGTKETGEHRENRCQGEIGKKGKERVEG